MNGRCGGGAHPVGALAVAMAWMADRAQGLFHLMAGRWPWAPFVLGPGGFALAVKGGSTLGLFQGELGLYLPQDAPARIDFQRFSVSQTMVTGTLALRPDGAAGNLALVGTDPDRIVAAAAQLLDDPAAHAAMARPAFPFGRGDAATKILDAIEQYFSWGAPDVRPLRSEPLWTKDGAR